MNLRMQLYFPFFLMLTTTNGHNSWKKILLEKNTPKIFNLTVHEIQNSEPRN